MVGFTNMHASLPGPTILSNLLEVSVWLKTSLSVLTSSSSMSSTMSRDTSSMSSTRGRQFWRRGRMSWWSSSSHTARTIFWILNHSVHFQQSLFTDLNISWSVGCLPPPNYDWFVLLCWQLCWRTDDCWATLSHFGTWEYGENETIFFLVLAWNSIF